MVKRTLYHFTKSPFSRRVRLALAHKGLSAEQKDGRENAEWITEAHRVCAIKTFPVLVETDEAGRVQAIGDSTSIVHYLDLTYREGPALWPREDAAIAFEVAGLVDVALNTLVDLGTRYFVLRDHAAWSGVREELVGRAQRALDALGERAAARTGRTLSSAGWSAADMWLYTAAAWLESMPARAPTTPNIAQILTLGWTLPPALPRWADAHRTRADVAALG